MMKPTILRMVRCFDAGLDCDHQLTSQLPSLSTSYQKMLLSGMTSRTGDSICAVARSNKRV